MAPLQPTPLTPAFSATPIIFPVPATNPDSGLSDDFGDFVESNISNFTPPASPHVSLKPVTDGLPPDFVDEWSLPTTAPPPLPVRTPTLPSVSIPYLPSSSPPPMDPSIPPTFPESDLVVEEFALPSEQFGFSDQQVFGIEDKKEKHSSRQQPQSFQDILLAQSRKRDDIVNVNKEVDNSKNNTKEDVGESYNNSRQGSPESLRNPTKSPESQSVASLDFINTEVSIEATKTLNHEHLTTKTQEVVEIEDGFDEWSLPAAPVLSALNGHDSELSPYKEWRLLLTEVLSLLESTAVTFNEIVSEELMNEVVSSSGGQIFNTGLRKVFFVVKRLEKSLQRREKEEVGYTVVSDMVKKVNDTWSGLEKVVVGTDYGIEAIEVEETSDEVTCSICLLGDVELQHGGSSYHASCANYWINCVSRDLPHL
jgi:hypothetical protein